MCWCKKFDKYHVCCLSVCMSVCLSVCLENILMIGILSVCGMPSSTFMRKTMRESMADMANVTFSPDSAGIRNAHLKEEICIVLRIVPILQKSLIHAVKWIFPYSQGKDVDEEGRGKIVEPVEHWSPPYLNKVPKTVQILHGRRKQLVEISRYGSIGFVAARIFVLRSFSPEILQLKDAFCQVCMWHWIQNNTVTKPYLYHNLKFGLVLHNSQKNHISLKTKLFFEGEK